MKKTLLNVLFLFLLAQISNFKAYSDMHDMPMDMPAVDQKAYTKRISVPETPQKVKDATLSKEEVLQIKISIEDIKLKRRQMNFLKDRDDFIIQ